MMGGLYSNCRQELSRGVCGLANVSAFCGTSIWLVTFLPQIWQNWRRHSVQGLSILWATALFTASLVNAFFVFHNIAPVYFRVAAVYMPIVQLCLLLQFWMYSSRYAILLKLYYGGGCCLLWAAFVTVELADKQSHTNVQWLAIVLWSIGTFPQIYLNIRLRNTSGQSTAFVALSVMGQTADFLTNYLLTVPDEYIVMTYFACTMVFINGIQVIWYPKPEPSDLPHSTRFSKYGSSAHREEEPLEADDCDRELPTADLESSAGVTSEEREESTVAICSRARPQHVACLPRFQAIPRYQLFLMAYLLLMTAILAVSVCVRTRSAFAIFAPLGTSVLLLGSLLYRAYQEGQLGGMHAVCSYLGNCCACADQPVQPTL